MLTVQMNRNTNRSRKAPAAKAETDLFADLMGEMEQLLGEELKKGGPRVALTPLKKTSRKSLLNPAQKLYLEMAQQHLQPLCRYMKAIRRGVQSKMLLEISALIVEPLIAHTQEMEMTAQAQALLHLRAAMESILGAGTKQISEAQDKVLREAFEPVQTLFRLNLRGHSVAVLNLVYFYKRLKGLKEMQKNELKMLFSIGIPCMTMLRKLSLEELVSLTGLSAPRAAEIRRTAREFELAWVLE